MLQLHHKGFDDYALHYVNCPAEIHDGAPQGPSTLVLAQQTRNQYWCPTINVDKLWTLVTEEEKKGLTKNSEVVPVIDTLKHVYRKVLGNGQLPKIPLIVKARFVSQIAE